MPDNEQKVILTADNRTKSALKSFRSDVNRSKDSVVGLQKASSLLRTGLGALGVAATGVGFVSMIRESINTQDSLAKLSQSTGIAVETLAGLDFAAQQSGTSLDNVGKGVRRFSRLILESKDGTDKYGKIIRALGLDLEKLKKSTPEEQFISLAGAIKNNVSEQERAVVITSLFGNEYANLIPLLSQGEQGLRDLIDQGRELNPVTEESARQAEEFNDNLDKLQESFGTLAIEASNTILPTLVNITNEFINAKRESGLFIAALKTSGQSLSDTIQSDAFFDSASFLGPLSPFVKLVSELNRGREALSKVEERAQSTEKAVSRIVIPGVKPSVPGSFRELFDEIDRGSKKASKSANKAVKQSESFLATLKKQAEQAGKTAIEIKRIEAANLGVSEAAEPYLEIIEEQIEKEKKLAGEREKQAEDLRLVEQITNSVKTAQELYNEQIDEYFRLLGEGKIDQDLFNRAIKQSAEEFDKAGKSSKRFFDDIDQFSIQAKRNIQNAFADLLSGRKSNFGDFIRNSSAQLSSQAILGGLEDLFSDFIRPGGAAGEASINNGILRSLRDLLGVTEQSNGFLADLVGTSAESSGFLGKIIKGSQLTGLTGNEDALTRTSFNAFNSLRNPNKLAGALTVTAGGLLGSSTTATAIAGLAATFGGPIGIGVGAVILGLDFLDKKFGDFELGGTGKALQKSVNVAFGLGPKIVEAFGLRSPEELIFKALFGRGPFKFKDETLLGEFTKEGFTGVLSDRFKSKGGIFRKNRTDNIIVDLDTGELLSEFGRLREGGINDEVTPAVEPAIKQAVELGRLLDKNVQSYVESLEETAEKLGFNKSALDDVAIAIDLVSKKGENLSEQQIEQTLSDVADELTRNLVPAIEDLRKIGETQFEAAVRITNELDLLSKGLLILGDSLDLARSKVLKLSEAERTKVVDDLGGLEAADQAFNDFFEILDPERQLRILRQDVSDRISRGTDGNVTAIPTLTQFIELMTSGNLSRELVTLGFSLTNDIAAIDRLTKSIDENANSADRFSGVNEAFDVLSQAVSEEQSKISEEISVVTGRISDLTAVLRLAGNAINIITPISKDAARSIIRNAINTNDLFDNDNLRSAVQTLTDQSTDGFSTRVDFLRDQAKSINILDKLESAAETQLTIEEQSLQELKLENDRLQSILDNAEKQLVHLGAISASLSVIEAQRNFNEEARKASNGQPLLFTGSVDGLFHPSVANAPFYELPSQITDQQILDALNANLPALEFADLAIANGVSSRRVAGVGGFAEQQRLDFLELLPDVKKFKFGGVVPRTGMALIHKDERVLSAEQNKDLVAVLREILTVISDVKDNTGRSTKILDDVSAGGAAFLTEAA